jgi:hypothetical protein
MSEFENPTVISSEEAAARCGITLDQFKAMANARLFFKARLSRTTWDRRELVWSFDHIAIQADKADRGYVYFMEMGDFIKIGWSHWPDSRMSSLQAASPYEIRILAAFPGSMDQESKLHELFAEFRHRREWFKRTPALLAYIEWMTKRAGNDLRVIKPAAEKVVSLRGAR